MTYVIFAFRSRTQSMSFASELRRRGVKATVINTPREVSQSCGLSVKLACADKDRAAELLRSAAPNTFSGAFLIRAEGGRFSAERLYL